MNMKLGVYRRPDINDDSDVYTRLALYDFNTGEWAETSSGRIVSKASADPSPEELKVRFDTDPNARTTIVATPERMEAEGLEVEVNEPSMSVAEGKAKRDKRGGPLLTQTEAQYRKREGVEVIDDNMELSDLDQQLIESEGRTIVRESEWDGLDFEAEFDFDFHTPDNTPR